MIKVGSDFSGVGAFDFALGRITPFKTVFACDWDKYARQSYIANHGEPPYYPSNVYDREIPKESLDIYMTSPPCQSFSLAGKRLGKNSDKGILFFNSHEFIQKNKPRFFIFENVKGLLSDDEGNTFQEWVNMLGGKSVNGLPILFPYENSVPYHLYWQVLNSKKHGVPQNRERVFLVGIRDDEDNQFQFPKEEHLTTKLKDVLEKEIFEKFYLSEKAIAKCLKSTVNSDMLDKEIPDESRCIVAGYYKIPFDGQYLKVKSNLDKYYLSDDMVKNLLVYNNRQVENNRGFSAKFRDIDNVDTMDALKCGGGGKDDLIKIKSATQCNQGVILGYTRDSKGKVVSRNVWENAGTIHTSSGGGGNTDQFVLQYDYKIRRLTPRECFRLQDFPDTFKFVVSDSQLYKQAGNSITVRVLEKILRNLKL
jgi:DNA (cytosine-5)-methyltransferase 1